MNTPRFLLRRLFLFATLVPSACAPKGDTAAPAEPAPAAPSVTAPTSGGLLFDRWSAVAKLTAPFKAGESGGPNGNGTLNNGSGAPLDPAGHDYRLKNFFGWDLRGSEGIYGPAYQQKPAVLAVNLLTDTKTVDDLAAWLARGDAELPAFGDVLAKEDLTAIATFIVDVRERRLPHPEQIWTLSDSAPNNYVLNPGADMAKGASLVAGKCTGCHGTDGTQFPIDGTYSLGAFARAKAYEAWFKVVSGQPGTAMGPQSGDAQEVLDILAVLCDREQYPAMPGAEDVPDGDARCGAYLK